MIQKPRGAGNEQGESLHRREYEGVIVSAQPPLLELNSQSRREYSGYVANSSLDRTRSKHPSSAFGSVHRLPTFHKIPRIHTNPTWKPNSTSIGKLVTEAVHPMASSPNDGQTGLEYHFSERLINDSGFSTGHGHMSGIPPHELEQLLINFAGRLYEESKTPFQWKASVRIYRKCG